MPSTDALNPFATRRPRHARSVMRFGALIALASLSACALWQKPPPAQAPAAERPAQKAPEPAAATGGLAGSSRGVKLPPPRDPRNWADVRRQAAERLVAANPDGSYMGKPPFMLLAIPVMTIELNADGSVRHISVMRHPSQAKDTVQLAIQAIHRAAPFGNVAKLPKPWKFNETFLFKEDRKFKPMTLDQPGS